MTLQDLLKIKAEQERPTIVCLCGSTGKAREAFIAARIEETLAGRIVLTIGVDAKSDEELLIAGEITFADKIRLDTLHFWKIDLCDEVLILNVNGYVGPSTERERQYAELTGKRIRWLEQPESIVLLDMEEV